MRQSQQHRMPVQSGDEIELLVVATYLAAIGTALAICTVTRGSDFGLIVSLIVTGAASAARRGDNALNRLEAHSGRTRSSVSRPPRSSFPAGCHLGALGNGVGSAQRWMGLLANETNEERRSS